MGGQWGVRGASKNRESLLADDLGQVTQKH